MGRPASVPPPTSGATNSVAVPSAFSEVIALLKALSEVASVDCDTSVVQLPSTDSRTLKVEERQLLGAPQSNIAQLNTGAPWDAVFLGEGEVVAAVDKGVHTTHEAAVDNYRGMQSASGPRLPHFDKDFS